MANTDTPMGFKPIRYLNGAAYDGKARICYVPAAETDRIGLYDLVTPGSSADPSGKYMDVTRSAAAEEDILGSVVGFGETPYMAFDPDSLEQAYRVGAALSYVWVADDPMLLFLAQDDGGATGAITNIGNNCEIVVANCSTTTGLSAMELAFGGLTTGVAQMRLEGLYDDPSNELGSINAKWLCRINEHAYHNTTGA